MLFSEARGRPVIDLATAEAVGTISTCTLAGSPARITGLRLKAKGRARPEVDWDRIHAFGSDAVTVDAGDRIRDERDIEPSDPAHSRHDPLDKPVLAETGAGGGTLMDIDFDEATGEVRHLITTDGRITGDHLLEVGSYATIVTD
ncbi:hypothetical protein BJP40_18615 [Streptomyces sp. CC53]|uniref:PRC-barrel domain-containing protein n=1 Tax=unclassified Streptomyces TaxID=2593676 RepID=UPI0008DD68A5|nr:MULTISPECIES: PRC-barrel domain-containing protein [unclassified Streptomyces]OII64998.1 hypothetical protein BJP40_18615 [Streptomyces sp. CC53]OII67405.1 hypothetical protein BJP39_24950 [Streptomyces sp. CC77]